MIRLLLQSADRCGQCESPAEPGNWCAKGRKECEEDCGHVWCDDGDDVCRKEGEDVYDSQGVRRDCCPGLVDSLEDRDPSDPLIGTYPQIIVCRPSRRNLRGSA